MKDTKRIKVLYNKLIIPIGLDRDLIEELTPSTSHKYISSKYNNEEIVTKCHGLESKDSHNENNVGYEQNNASNDHTPIQPQLDTSFKKELDTPTPVQASNYIGLEEQGGIQAKLDTPYPTELDTPIQPQLDTNILRVNNLYTYGIERLFTIYNINNNNIRAREFDEPSYVINLVNNKSKISESVTNCHQLKLTDSEKQDSSYADNAFGFLTEPMQSAFIATKPF